MMTSEANERFERFVNGSDLTRKEKGYIIAYKPITKMFPPNGIDEYLLLLLNKAIEHIVDLEDTMRAIKGE